LCFGSWGSFGSSLFLTGESYGSCLTIHVARHLQDHPEEPTGTAKRFDSFCVNAPAIVPNLPPYPVYFVLRFMLAPLFPTWLPSFMPNPISAERIWRDEEVRAFRTSGRYSNMGIDGSGRPFRLGTAVNLLLALEASRTKAIPGLKVPFCTIHGTNDYGVPIEGSELLYAKSDTPEADKCFYRKEGAYHDLLSDPLAEKVIEHILDWILKRTKK
jgi:pimeloyl-ACP methyl ester carboxylesterase